MLTDAGLLWTPHDLRSGLCRGQKPLGLQTQVVTAPELLAEQCDPGHAVCSNPVLFLFAFHSRCVLSMNRLFLLGVSDPTEMRGGLSSMTRSSWII